MSSFLTFVLYVLALCTSSYAATKQFSIELAWAAGSPDGFERQIILVTGQSPGLALVIDQDDDVEVRTEDPGSHVLELIDLVVFGHQ